MRNTVVGFAVAAVLSLLVVAKTSPAAAQAAPPASVAVDVGGRSVKFLASDGQCILDRAQTADRSIMDLVTRALAGKNELLFHTAKCNEISDVRAGKRQFLDTFMQGQVLVQLRATELAGQEASAPKEICKVMRAQGEALNQEVVGDMRTNISNLAVGLSLNEQKLLGVLDEDATACYVGMLVKLGLPDGKTRTLLSLLAFTVLNGRGIYLYHFQASPNDETVGKLLPVLKISVGQHIAANRAR